MTFLSILALLPLFYPSLFISMALLLCPLFRACRYTVDVSKRAIKVRPIFTSKIVVQRARQKPT